MQEHVSTGVAFVCFFPKGEFARAPPLLRHNARRRLHVTSPRNSMSEFLTLGKSQTLPKLEDFEHRAMHSPPALAVSPPKGAEPSQRLLGGSPAKWAGSPSWPKHALNDAASYARERAGGVHAGVPGARAHVSRAQCARFCPPKNKLTFGASRGPFKESRVSPLTSASPRDSTRRLSTRATARTGTGSRTSSTEGSSARSNPSTCSASTARSRRAGDS